MAPGGQFIVSTPNKHFYAETRRIPGPIRFTNTSSSTRSSATRCRASFHPFQCSLRTTWKASLSRGRVTGGADVRLEGRHDPPHRFELLYCRLRDDGADRRSDVRLRSARGKCLEGTRAPHRSPSRRARDERCLAPRRTRRARSSSFGEHRDQTAELEESNTWAQHWTASSGQPASASRFTGRAASTAGKNIARNGCRLRGADRAQLPKNSCARTEWAQSNDAKLAATVELLDQSRGDRRRTHQLGARSSAAMRRTPRLNSAKCARLAG